MITRIYNCRLLRDHQIKFEDLWFKDGIVIEPAATADQEIDAKGSLIAPGYIDIQVNGAFGYDFTTDIGCVEDVCKQLPRFGVTSFLATLITSTKENYHKILPTLKKVNGGKAGANCLGVHLEGPFLNPKQKGAHREEWMEFPQDHTLEKFYGTLSNVVLMTLAPELPGAIKAIRQLTKNGIRCAIGHSDASSVQIEEAVEAGATLATHLFNAMTPFHHRVPGVVGTALTNPNLYCSIICDGIHLNPAAIEIVYRCKGPLLILITDAISALGLSEGTYRLGDDIIEVDGKKAYLPSSKQLAGAIGPLDAAVRLLRKSTGCSMVEALEAASLRPAQFLGIADKKGTLAIGADADFVMLDDDLWLHGCWVAGVMQVI